MIIAVFEDDREYAAKLEALIRQYTHYPTAVNTGEAQEMISFAEQAQGSVLYFLDIVKEERSDGFQIAEQISEIDSGSLIVFLTAYPQKISCNAYFKTKSFSCIYKDNPSLEREVCETIRLAEQALSGQCILIHAGRFETLYIPCESIYFIEAVKGTGKLCIHSEDGQHIIRESLRAMEKDLEAHGFVRCHRSILVNAEQVARAARVDKSGKTIFFPGGASCPYSDLRGGWMK